ncbi:hypothetical protein HY285_04335 [Candidatus Peregrinibacteria bacterium]|nr:hypothetical protein [Candidatus Peregrinibacteria bacterium]MBI3816741.1 hypothetical protein [Candidatus Peregrinibacteria bacterium]
MQFQVSPLRLFAHRHDVTPAFHAASFALTILVAALLNLGWFALLIVLHMALDTVKYRDMHRLSWPKTACAVLRESLLDCTLLILAFDVEIYLRGASGIVALSALFRGERTLLEGLFIFLPKVAVLMRFTNVLSTLRSHLGVARLDHASPLSIVERVCLTSAAAGFLFFLLAPLSPELRGSFLAVVSNQLLPWRL